MQKTLLEDGLSSYDDITGIQRDICTSSEVDCGADSSAVDQFNVGVGSPDMEAVDQFNVGGDSSARILRVTSKGSGILRVTSKGNGEDSQGDGGYNGLYRGLSFNVMDQPGPGPRRGPFRKRPCKCNSMEALSIWLVYFTVFVDFISFSMFLPVLPFYALNFKASTLQTGVLLSCYPFAQFISTMFLGKLSDKVGRRPVLLLSLLGSAAGAFAQGFAESLGYLILFRTLTGLLGGSATVAQAFVCDTIHKDRGRDKALAKLSSFMAVGFVVGPPLGTLAERLYDLSGPAHLAGIVASVTLVLAFFIIREPQRSSTSSSSRPPSAHFDEIAHAASASNGGTNRRPKRYEQIIDPSSENGLSAFSLSFVLQEAWFENDEEERHPNFPNYYSVSHPEQHQETNTSRNEDLQSIQQARRRVLARLLVAAAGLDELAFSSFAGLFGLYTNARFGFASFQVGIAFALCGVIFMVTQVVLYPTLRRCFSMTDIIVVGVAIVTISYLAISLEGWVFQFPVEWFCVWEAFSVVGHAVKLSCHPTILSAISPPFKTGATLGKMQSFNACMRATGPLVFTALLACGQGSCGIITVGYFVAFGCSFISLCLALAIRHLFQVCQDVNFH